MALLSQARAPTRTAYGVYGYASSSAENLSDDNVRRAGEGLNVNVYKNTGAAEPSWGGGVVAGWRMRGAISVSARWGKFRRPHRARGE